MILKSKLLKAMGFLLLWSILAAPIAQAAPLNHRFRCVQSLRKRVRLSYEKESPQYHYLENITNYQINDLYLNSRKYGTRHDKALSYLVFMTEQHLSKVAKKNFDSPKNQPLHHSFRLTPLRFTKYEGPAFQDNESIQKLSSFIKNNPLVERAIEDLDLGQINLHSLAKKYPALFQLVLHGVLKHNPDIKVISQFISALPISWLKKTISRSFLIDESNDSTIRKISNLLVQLGRHDLYTREHSMMVGLLCFKFYLHLLVNNPEQFQQLVQWDLVGQPIEKTSLLSEKTIKNLVREEAIQIEKILTQPVILVKVRLTPNQTLPDAAWLSELQPLTLSLIEKTSTDKNQFLATLNKEFQVNPQRRFVEKLLILSSHHEIELLKKQSILTQEIKTNEPFYLTRIKFDFDHYVNIQSDSLNKDPNQTLEFSFWGAAAHDVGKKTIPLDVLNKKGKLDREEFSVMESHALASFGQIISYLPPQDPRRSLAFPGLLHHERMDGKGYPLGLQGHQIPLKARIVAIADAFHAMISDRPYRAGMSYDDATRILKRHIEEGQGQWDNNLVALFLDFIEYERQREQN